MYRGHYMSDNNTSQDNPNTENDLLKKVENYNTNYVSTEETSDPDSNISEKIIQILVGEEGIPTVQYNGATMSIAEVIGLLDMSKEILLKKNIGNALLQQNLYNMLQGLGN